MKSSAFVCALLGLILNSSSALAADENCYRIGPFNHGEAKRWQSQLQAHKLDAWLASVEDRNNLIGTWLLLPTTNSSDAQALSAKLKNIGVNDHQIIKLGNFKDWISIGVFSKQEGVNRRLMQVESLGRKVIRHKRYRKGERYDVEFRAAPELLVAAGLDAGRLKIDCSVDRQ